MALNAPSIAAQVSNAGAYSIKSNCVDTISVVPTIPSIVYVEAAISDSVGEQVGQMADIFAQSVAQRVRILLHERGDTLPPGEPAITWREITDGTPVVVRMVRDSEPVYDLVPGADSVASAMLVNAAHIAADSGEGPFMPPGFTGDTLVFGISYVLSARGSAGVPAFGRTSFPVFSVMFPPSSPTRPTGRSLPRYPEDLRYMGVTGVVITTFVVDTTGHAIPETIKDVWSPSQKRLTGDLLGYYNEFAQTVFKWIRDATFKPARIGGCPVPQLVTQPFTFSITH
jgi:hypothetical protein